MLLKSACGQSAKSLSTTIVRANAGALVLKQTKTDDRGRAGSAGARPHHRGGAARSGGAAPGPRRPPLAPARRPPGRADPPRGRGLAWGARWLRLVRRRLTRDTLEASAAPRRP